MTIMLDAVKKQKWVGSAVWAGLYLLWGVLRKPGLAASIKSFFAGRLCGRTEDRPAGSGAVDRVADAIVALFRKHHVDPRRIAIDGLPGSGKSTLAAALGRRLGMEVECLDYRKVDAPIRFKSRTIYEHHRLLRTQDLDRFDAVIYIDEPAETSKRKVLDRKRGGYLVDIMDFHKSKAIGKKAFSVAAGKCHAIPGSFVVLKLRPKGGFRDAENIDRELRDKDLPEGAAARAASKEQKLFLCVEGRAKSGFAAYLDPRAYEQDILSAMEIGLAPIRGKHRR